MEGPRPLLGQMNFESGLQWGYWLANSAQAAVAWRRFTRVEDVFDYLLRSLAPTPRGRVVAVLGDFASAQHRLLVEGLRARAGEGGGPGPPPKPPLGIGQGALTGMAYIQGDEGLSDLGGLLARYLGQGAPNPDRVRFADMWADPPISLLRFVKAFTHGRSDQVADALLGGARTARQNRRWYRVELRPLLADMNDTFTSLARRLEEEVSLAVPSGESELLQDLVISSRLLGLRCGQVLALYDHAADCGSTVSSFPAAGNPRHSWCVERMAASRAALKEALALIPEREANYGMEAYGLSLRSVTAWQKPVPTAYSYGYLWGAHNLFYWQRDQAIVEQRIYNPCFMPINDPVELGLAGGGAQLVHGLRSAIKAALSNSFWQVDLAECLGVPGPDEIEPRPQDSIAAARAARCRVDGCEM